MSNKKESISKMILSCYPDWIINSISFLGEGDFCAAYLVNEEWVFRFAKHEDARNSLQREYCLLPQIAKQITLQIPNPQIASFETTPAFSAYRFLKDNSLSQNKYLQFSETDKTKCAVQVADFMNELHSLETTLAQNCGVEICDYQSQYENLLIEAKEHLFPILESVDCLFIEQTIEEYLTANHSFQPVLLHGDLSPDHVLFDADKNSVSGIIDFGDMMIGDAAWDLLWIYEDYGLDFLKRVLPKFHDTNRETLLLRLFQFSRLQMIEWTVNCKINRDEELKIALSELSKMRVGRESRFDELIRACKIE